jgi:hypothetical protein
MTTFTTTVAQMYTLPNNEIVVTVNYCVTGVDGTYTADVEFSQQFIVEQGESFTPYGQLTETQVVGWADAKLVSDAQICVQANISRMMNPPVFPLAQTAPWGVV